MDKDCKDCEINTRVSTSAIEAVKKYKDKSGTLMMSLHYIQDKEGYISYENQKYLSKNLNASMAEIYGIITFYNRFSLVPKGKYNIQVCLGTACYVKGAEKLINALEEKLKIKAGQTTEDKLFSIEKVRCLGNCNLAPAVLVNNELYGKVTIEMLDEIIEKCRNTK